LALFFSDIADTISTSYEGLITAKRKMLKEARKETDDIIADSEDIINDIFLSLKTTSYDEKVTVPHYARKIGAIQVIIANLTSLTRNNFMHIDNNHHAPDELQAKEIREANKRLNWILKNAAQMINTNSYHDIAEITIQVQDLKNTIRKFDKHQMNRIKNGKAGTRQSLLFVSTLSKVERIAEQVINLIELCKDTVRIM
ncbi:hypothetical protein L0Z72_15235, partial [candidate division KSB1 bacterium]|nr:hypothetical protein [candidate division KSB1 bacterium]